VASTQGIRAGRAFVELFADDSRLVRGLRRAEKKLRAFGGSIRNFGLKLAGAVSAVVAPLGALTIRAAADAQESLSRFEQVFKDQAEAAGSFADEVAKSVGRSKFAIRDALANFQSFFVGLGFDPGKSRELSQTLQTLALDFASFNNLSDEEAIQRFIAALSGSGEVLDRFGVNIKQAALQQELLRMGVRKSWTEVTEQEKALARLNIIMRSMGDQGAVGDAVRTAGSFTNQMKRLRGQVRDTAVSIGQALLPIVTPLVAKVAEAAKWFGRWVSRNQQLVATVFKVAAAVIGMGGALVILGVTISGFGAALGGLATLVTGVGAAFGVLASAIGFLVSPIGLVLAALGALGAFLVQTTGVAGEALDWLGERFGELKDTALRAYQGIADALAAGDIGLAARILWLTLKQEWIKGVNFIKGLWLSFKHFIADALVGAFTGALAALQIIWHGLEVVWIETTAFLAKAWHGFVNIFLRTWERMKALATKAWNFIEGLFSDSVDVSVANEQVDRALERRLAEIDAGTGEAVIGTELRREARRQRAAQLNEQTLGVIGQRFEDEQSRQAKQRAEAEADAEKALLEARREWEQAIAEAKQKRSAAEAEEAGSEEPGLPRAPEPPDLSGLSETISREAERVSAVGAFNPAALLGLAFDTDTAERTAVAAEETARNTKKIERGIKTGNLAFA